MWIIFPLAPSHGICGMSTIADLCIPCHILTALWIIIAVMLWTRVVYVSYGTVSWCQLHLYHGIPMGTNCAPLRADIFLYSYEA